jgi:hypothetical protein
MPSIASSSSSNSGVVANPFATKELEVQPKLKPAD